MTPRKIESIVDRDELRKILDLKLKKKHNSAKAKTVREWLTMLLAHLWREGEQFSAKYAFGDSDWQWELIPVLAKAGYIEAELDEDDPDDYGYISISDEEEMKYYGIVYNAIIVMGEP